MESFLKLRDAKKSVFETKAHEGKMSEACKSFVDYTKSKKDKNGSVLSSGFKKIIETQL